MERKVVSAVLILLLAGMSALAFIVPPVESSGRISMASNKPARFYRIQETASEILLATIPFCGELIFGPAEWSGAAVFTLSRFPSRFAPKIGDELTDHWYSGTTGSFDFTAENEPDFNDVTRALTNGEDDIVWLSIWCNGYEGGQSMRESVWKIGNPDLFGHDIAFVRLTVHSLLVSHVETYTSVHHNCTWEIWGRLSADVSISPRALNLRSGGRWVTSSIGLPEGHDVNDVNVSSIRLNGTVPIDWSGSAAIGDCDSDTSPHLTAKFDRAEVMSCILSNIDPTELEEGGFMIVTLTITGRLNDGTPFQGSDEIKLIFKGVHEIVFIVHVLRRERRIERLLSTQRQE